MISWRQLPTTGGRSTTRHIARAATLLLVFVVAAVAQAPWQNFGNAQRRPGGFAWRAGGEDVLGEFTFVRGIYNSPAGGWRRGSWTVDFPRADEHFITGIREWVGTNLSVSSQPQQVHMSDDRIFDYPLLYYVEPGYMELSEEEAARLREYLTRGGFIFLDDFHGDYEFENVREQMRRVFPEYELKDLPPTHPIFHSYLDINEVVQVPGVASLRNGVTYEKGGVTPHYMGIEDKNGRLVVFITRNCDLGDAWEWINDSRYPVQYGVMAYRIGINVIIYAMTH